MKKVEAVRVKQGLQIQRPEMTAQHEDKKQIVYGDYST